MSKYALSEMLPPFGLVVACATALEAWTATRATTAIAVRTAVDNMRSSTSRHVSRENISARAVRFYSPGLAEEQAGLDFRRCPVYCRFCGHQLRLRGTHFTLASNSRRCAVAIEQP